MKRKDVDEFEKISGQIQVVYDELSVLSKKSPNEAVNKFKLNFVNKLLNDSNVFLGEKYRPFEDFSEFDIDDVPINSDVVFILSQYLQCFEKMRADNVKYKHPNWNWLVDAEENEPGDEAGKVYIKTIRPKRLRE
ncbi:hypothetical protein [Anabaena sp. UHCC 0204]|uniref:hypothetical protein n=1 Tax=Anabaena sp. UHCC 0204 TaxID=2590009 RepID=UPI001444D338|nr:hypothetical protein [Anabaena sp. UHCC 0204]MTJ10058.1 hypothetical protein [Anabaena sp. UHCC 0204]